MIEQIREATSRERVTQNGRPEENTVRTTDKMSVVFIMWKCHVVF